jgi:phasin family protein
MYQSPEQLMQFGKSSIETALSVANITLQGTERLVGLQLKTAKEVLDEGIRSAQALSGAKNVQEFLALQSNSAQPSLEKALAYSRTVYELASETQSQISRVIEDRMAKASDEFVAAVDKAVKTAPAGSESALAAFKSAVVAANTAYETMSKVARDATDVAVSAATTTASKTAKKKA